MWGQRGRPWEGAEKRQPWTPCLLANAAFIMDRSSMRNTCTASNQDKVYPLDNRQTRYPGLPCMYNDVCKADCGLQL